MKFGRLVLLLSLVFLQAFPAGAEPLSLPQDNSSAVILAYHRIGEDEQPVTSIRLEQFEDHIRELRSGGYSIMPLPEIVEALRTGRTLPDRTVALTFDGNHRSAYESGVPLLLRQDIPFTIFIAPDLLQENENQFISTAELRKLARNRLVTIGLHPDRYIRLNDRPEEEVRRQVNNAIARYRELLGRNPDLFAYPFGEYSKAYRDIVAAAGFKAALGQQSGVANPDSDIYALPRFPMTEAYGDHERFRLVAGALPLPASDVEPADPHLTVRQPSIGFTIDEALAGRVKDLSCFVSGQEQIRTERISENRVELRLEEPFEGDRARINCTLPVSTQEGEEPRWRWFGLLLTF